MPSISRLLVLVFMLALNGCVWLGVETLKPIEVEEKSIYVSEVKETKEYAKKIEIGASTSEGLSEISCSRHNPSLKEPP